MKARIYINRHIVKANSDGRGANQMDAPISVKSSKGTEHYYTVAINGPSVVHYDYNACPRVWIECRHEDILTTMPVAGLDEREVIAQVQRERANELSLTDES